jgi:cell division protein FtsQ
MWLRDCTLVSVEHVHISGAHGADARAIRIALDEAAGRMSTLHVKMGPLRAAVAPFRVVRDLKVSSGFPHTLNIHVIEQPPVAALTLGGVKTAAAADGAILGPGSLTHSLPLVSGAGSDAIGGGQVKSAATLAALRVLGAAPPALAGWVVRVYSGKEGLTVTMRNGLSLYFGDATLVHAKWLSAARVLADPSSQGAWYVDVRLPERPAVGLAAGNSAVSETTGSTQVSASDPTAASLATSLAEAVNGAPPQAAAPAETSTGEATPAPAETPTREASPASTSAASPASGSEATTSGGAATTSSGEQAVASISTGG